MAKKKQKRKGIKSMIDGSVLTRAEVMDQLPYILFLTVLAIVYIGNRYHAEKVVREKSQLQREIRELRSEAITTSAELMKLSKQSEVYQLVRERGLGLTESTEPPKKLIMEDN